MNSNTSQTGLPDIALRPVHEQTHYYQATYLFECADGPLELPRACVRVRRFSPEEACSLGQRVRKANLFARHSTESDFYQNRIRELSGRTVLEVVRLGHPDRVMDRMRETADQAEKALLLCSLLTKKRTDYLRHYRYDSHRWSLFDLTIGAGGQVLRSRSRPGPDVRPLRIDGRFIRRFHRLSFPALLTYSLARNDLSNRVRRAVDWLYDSRLEARPGAAIVKTAIALECLLIFGESEPPRRTLAERASFILSSDADTRMKIAKAMRDFYDARSATVHGGRGKQTPISSQMLEGVDRLTALLCLSVSTMGAKWQNNADGMRNWCEMERWGSPDASWKRPFGVHYLRNALALCKP